jgi:phospholipid/cholesterol/gamma-HCH transport system substrate-binding protein
MLRTKNGTRTESYFVLHGMLLLGVVVTIVASGLAARGSLAHVTRVTAHMTDIGGGVVPGSDVKVRGLVVGNVRSVTGTPGNITLDLGIADRELGQIPGDVKARVLPASVFGTSYVDLVRGTTGHLTGATAIEQDRSAQTLELQRALDSIDGLVKALGPADLSVVLHALAGSLDGRGSEIGDTVDRLDHLLSVVNPRMPLFRQDLRLLVTNARTLQQVAPQLLDTLDNTTSIANGVVGHRRRIHEVLVAAIDLVDDGDHLLDATETKYVRAILESAGVVDAVYDERTGIPAESRALDTLLNKILTITDGGPIRIEARLVDPARYDYYTRADCPRYGTAGGSNCAG